MPEAINFKTFRIKAIAFDGGGTVYPKGVKDARISQDVTRAFCKAASRGLKLGFISYNSCEVDFPRVTYPLRDELALSRHQGLLSAYVDGCTRLFRFGPAESADTEFSKPFYIVPGHAFEIRCIMLGLLQDKLGLTDEEQASWANFYKEKHPGVALPWLSPGAPSPYPLEYFPLITPKEEPHYAPWLEKRAENLKKAEYLMLAIKVLPREPREVRGNIIDQIFRSSPWIKSKFKLTIGGFGSIDIVNQKAGKGPAMKHFMTINNLKPQEVIYFGDELAPRYEDSDLLERAFYAMPKISVNGNLRPKEKVPNLIFGGSRTGPDGTAAWLKEIVGAR